MRKCFRMAGISLVAFLIVTSPVWAQTGATLSGVVQDASGAVLPGATVVARHLGTRAVRETVAGIDGRFALGNLQAGAYEVRSELNGFRPLIRSGINLTVGENASLTLVLVVGAAEVVTVTGAASQVNTRTSELSYLVDQRTMAQIPVNGRNYTDLMSLLPAVTPFPHRDNGSVVAHGLAMSVNGQDPRANVYLLDGTLLNDFTNSPAGSAAGTALGMDTVQEFRLESNTYRAEFGRNIGGQINAITKSGTNRLAGSLFEFHRNEWLDARGYFDSGDKPTFVRNQFGGTIGGPLQTDRLFFFGGYEALIENLGRTVVTTVPDDNARLGVIGGVTIPINPAIVPFLNEFPRANGESIGGGLARYTFPFDQTLRQHFVQGRVDAVLADGKQFFTRYTFDDAEQRLPTDFPQFPRSFISTNQYVTAEYRQALSSSLFHTLRAGYSRTRVGQDIEANTATPLPVFAPGREFTGAIDIGGMPRFGPQLSARLRLRQDVFSLNYDITHTRGRHLFKAGAVAEHSVSSEFNPTFSLGLFRFANLAAFLRNTPAVFIGLTPAGDTNRTWPFTVFGAYLQDDWQVRSNLTLNLGLRVEGSTMPVDEGGRDINMRDLLGVPTVGPLYDNPAPTLSPRVGLAWNVREDGRTSIRGGYGLYYNTNNHQNLIVTVTNPPATPRVVIGGPSFPVPQFERLSGISVRPIQYDVELPRVHMWNVNVQQEFFTDWMVMVGYAGSRGQHLWRNSDVNVPAPTTLSDGTLFYPAGLTRPNTRYSAIELKSSDGESWYKALIVEVKKRWSNGLQLQSSYTWSESEDTTQNSTFFSDSTTASVSAMPEFINGYNKGYSDFHARHNWVTNFVWEPLSGWRLSGIYRMRSGSPLTPFVQTNRSRSLWSPSLGPGTGPDRPSYAPGFNKDNAVTGDPSQWFNPAAFVLQPVGTFGNVGRNELMGPDLQTMDLALSRTFGLSRLSMGRGTLELRAEVFNLFNRANFGPPSLVAFSGTTNNEAPLSSFGQIRSTITSARQAQLGIRISF
ncbi:MAG: TonB-dependent receptor [Acidobacteria bacterium]|nr:TonB-dependent receptor [Acidobacteriota bacterium]